MCINHNTTGILWNKCGILVMKLFASELELRCVEGEIEEVNDHSEITRNLLYVRNTGGFKTMLY
jgi:hypothetical protein